MEPRQVHANQPSELVEFTTSGQFVTQTSVDPLNGGAFGLALGSGFGAPQFAGQTMLATVDDNQATVMVRDVL